MTLAKPAATPWKVFDGGDGYLGIEAPGVSVVVYGLLSEPETGVRGVDMSQAKANAELIVRAVNNHDALIGTLEAALEWIDAVPKDTPLPVMPGFDRDWANTLLARSRGLIVE